MQMELARAILLQGQHGGLARRDNVRVGQRSADGVDQFQSQIVRSRSATTTSEQTRSDDCMTVAVGDDNMAFDHDMDHHISLFGLDSTQSNMDLIDPQLTHLSWVNETRDGDNDLHLRSPSSSLRNDSTNLLSGRRQRNESVEKPAPSASTRSQSPLGHDASSSTSSPRSLQLTTFSNASCTNPLADSSNFLSIPTSPESTGLPSVAGPASIIRLSSSDMDDLPKSPLLTAISLGNLEMARILADAGAKFDEPDANGNTPLHHAIQRGDVKITRGLLSLGADILRPSGDRSALHMAVEAGSEDVVREILGWCAQNDANTKDSVDQCSQNRPPPEMSLCMLSGNNGLLTRCINARDKRNLTALHLCVKLQRIDLLRALIEYGADVNCGM